MTRKTNLPTYLTLEEAADMLAVSVKTIRRRIARAACPATGAVGSRSECVSTSSKPPSGASPRSGRNGIYGHVVDTNAEMRTASEACFRRSEAVWVAVGDTGFEPVTSSV